jgi:hypothetical protein
MKTKKNLRKQRKQWLTFKRRRRKAKEKPNDLSL